MRDFGISVEIDAPPATVWAVLRDSERWPEWTSTVTSVTSLDSGPMAVGKRVRIVQPKLPPAVWEITEVEEGRPFTWVTRSPGATVTARHRVEPTATGSKATLALRFDGPLGGLVGRMTRKLDEQYLAIEVAGLKARGERASSPRLVASRASSWAKEQPTRPGGADDGHASEDVGIQGDWIIRVEIERADPSGALRRAAEPRRVVYPRSSSPPPGGVR